LDLGTLGVLELWNVGWLRVRDIVTGSWRQSGFSQIWSHFTWAEGMSFSSSYYCHLCGHEDFDKYFDEWISWKQQEIL